VEYTYYSESFLDSTQVVEPLLKVRKPVIIQVVLTENKVLEGQPNLAQCVYGLRESKTSAGDGTTPQFGGLRNINSCCSGQRTGRRRGRGGIRTHSIPFWVVLPRQIDVGSRCVDTNLPYV